MTHPLGDIAQSAFSTMEGLQHSYSCATDTLQRATPGVFVECGVAGGAQIGAMSRAVQDRGDTREFHLFDSFEGIPMAGPKDHDQPGIGMPAHDVSAPIRERLVSSGISVGTVQQVQENLERWGCFQTYLYHKGWFQDTMPLLSDFPRIALLRLDGDLYESTMCCLEHLYPHVVKGGTIIIDDWSLIGCRMAVDEYLKCNGLAPDIFMDRCGDGYTIASWYKN